MDHSNESLPNVEIFKQLADSCEAIEVAFRSGQSLDIEALVAAFPAQFQQMVRSELQGVLFELENPDSASPLEDTDCTYDVFNDYTVIEPLAQGGMGQVLVAWDEELSRRVALKEIHPNSADDARYLRRFLQESIITARLEHPGILPVYSRGVNSDERPFYTMRLVAGGNAKTLQEAIEAFQSTKSNVASHHASVANVFRDLLRRLIDVCNTVGYAHSQGICHRDLKPANILIGPFGETLVVDWGLAKVFQGPDPFQNELSVGISPTRDSASEGIGTRGFVAPESFGQVPIADWPRLDVYSLGAILYCILTNTAPEATQQSPREIEPEAPKALEAVCLKALSHDPRSRYATAIELADDLERYLAGQPVSVLREGPIDRTVRWINNNRKLATACLVLGSLLAILVGVNAVQQTTYNKQLREKSQKLSESYSSELKLRQQESEARNRAEAQEQIARKREVLALGALRTYTDAITTNETLKNARGLGPIRRELLEKPLAFFEQIHKDESESSKPSLEYLEQLASLSEQMARLSFEYSDPVQCARWTDRTIERYEELVAMTSPESAAKAKLSLAGSYRLRGVLKMPLDKQSAGKSLEHALELVQQCSDDPAQKETVSLELANIYTYQAILAAEMGDRPAMAKSFDLAIKQREELLDIAMKSSTKNEQGRDATVATRQFELESLRQDQAQVGLVLQYGDIQSLFEQFERHVAYLKQQIRDGNQSEEMRLRLAWAVRNLATHHRNYGHLEDSLRCFKDAVELRQELTNLYPSVTRYRADLSGTQGDLAETLRRVGSLDEAIEYSKRSIEGYRELLKELPQESAYRIDLAMQLHFLGHLLLDSFRDQQAKFAFDDSMELANQSLELNPTNAALQALFAELLWHQSHMQLLEGKWHQASDSLSKYWEAYNATDTGVATGITPPDKVLHLWEYCCIRIGDAKSIDRITQQRKQLGIERIEMNSNDKSSMGQLKHLVSEAETRLNDADRSMLAQLREPAIQLQRQALESMQNFIEQAAIKTNESKLTNDELLEIWTLTFRNPSFVTVRLPEELKRWPDQDQDAWGEIWRKLRLLGP